MNVYEVQSMPARLQGNTYPGRGIVVGKTADGKHAAFAYFIMGRSANSRNRIFTEKDGAVFTEPFDASKVEDPSLIIYAAIRKYENKLIVTNGDQTDTVWKGLKAGIPFADALAQRCFEPDPPNFTPRISAMATFAQGDFSYQMSILKSGDEEGSFCNRYTYSYGSAKAGVGHFIHTYQGDGNPLPSFEGEPEKVAIEGDIDTFTNAVWDSLNPENKVSLFVRFIDLKTGKAETRIVNKNQ